MILSFRVDKMQKNMLKNIFLWKNIWRVSEKAVLLHRVFHGIRFKVK